MPPFLSDDEKALVWSGDDGDALVASDRVRLVRRECCRIVVEEGVLALYHSVQNTRTYREVPPQVSPFGQAPRV